MKNDPLDDPLAIWRRKLTEVELAELRAQRQFDAEAQADLEEENRLTESLTRLSDAPVPSNFTARVLQAVRNEEAARQSKSRGVMPWFRRWIPRVALACVAAVATTLLTLRHQAQIRREELAGSVVAVSGVASLPSPDILQDFEVIRVLNSTPGADEQLLTLLQ